ncbi:MAG: acylphosphatase [Candidatus Cryosericum sp.]|nr:acylphosphatase [bacterium]
MKILTADVSGRVQGVGFRSFVERAAARLGLDARAENMDDGTVHVVASGDEHQLMRLVDLLKQGNRYSSVERVDYTIVEHRPRVEGS